MKLLLICLCASTLVLSQNATEKENPRPRLASLPTIAQSRISALVARDIQDYRMQRSHNGFTARNSKQKLLGFFSADGVQIRTGKLRVGFVLRGYGYGKIRQSTSALPAVKFNCIEYHRGQLTELYANGPLGLEQGFTIYRHPPGANGVPLTIALGLKGEFKASIGSDGDELILADAQGASLRYAGLTAFDATGKPFHSWLQLDGHRLLLQVADAGARYPMVIDSLIQLAELTASDGRSGDALGWSIGISGNTVVVGAINANNYGPGAVYVFEKPLSGWANMTQTAKLTGNGLNGSEFGYYVAISGNTVVAAKSLNALPSGVCVFVEPAGGWADMGPTAILTASDGSFAGNVAIAGDTIAAGAPGATINGNSGQGAAYVYVRPTGGWVNMTETARLTASDGKALDGFGTSVGISGNTVVVGAYGANQQAGAGYVFVEPATGWVNMTQTARLKSTNLGKQRLGLSVAIDSNTVVLGAPFASFGGQTQAGAAYIFTEPSGGQT